MVRSTIWTCVLLTSALPLAAGPLDEAAAGIELRYNRLATMQVDFEQTTLYAGKVRSAERGKLALLRPGKMRWDYSKPKGRLMIGDGEVIRMYNPRTNQARTVQLGAEADMRAPLGFLLGRLRLKRQFKNLRIETIEGRRALVGEGRTGGEAYDRVEFFYEPSFRLYEIRAYGRDDSTTVFAFDDEVRNETLDEALFVFKAPDGAEILEAVSLGAKQ